MTSAELIAEIEALILSGGRRTTAVNVRQLSTEFVNSFLNKEDFFIESVADYVAGDGTIQPLPPVEFGSITGDPSDQTNLQEGTIQGTFTPENTAILENDAFKTAFEKTQGQFNALPSNPFVQGGNSFAANAILGTNDLYDLLFKTNNVSRGGVSSTGKLMFGLTTPITDTDVSIKGSGNTSATYAMQIQDIAGGTLGWWRNDGGFNVQGGKYYANGALNMYLDAANISASFLSNAGLGATGNNNFFAGNGAGASSTGSYKNCYGTSAGGSSTGDYLNTFGVDAGYNSQSSYSFFAGLNAGKDAVGDALLGIGIGACQTLTGSNVVGIGGSAGRLTTISDAVIFGSFTDIFFNFDKAQDALGTTLKTVTLQTAQAKDGTDISAAASIFKIAPARGTGNAASGNIVIQRANVQASGTTRHTLSDWWYFQYDGKTGIGTSPFTDTDVSIKGSGNTSATYNTQWKSSSADIGWIKNDGTILFSTSGAVLSGSYFATASGYALMGQEGNYIVIDAGGVKLRTQANHSAVIKNDNITNERTFQFPDIDSTIQTENLITRKISAAYTTAIRDQVIICTANTFTVDLISAVNNEGKWFTVKNAGAGNITVDGALTETVDGALTQTLTTNQAITVMSDGINWIIINRY